ncbi:MAG TPA: glycosyltransferase [Candidatus Binatus sp.]|uniref:glycosyltransferase family 2 protein n=1 Tax=Candidatus Binatus sp. TaxID=2811406 RepID=UPI002B4819D4|nr:glycosyltransferase [Candidatus Binatus sp.]HKN14067.1 glycosyltransferase [Candidatus Binatus sp.]
MTSAASTSEQGERNPRVSIIIPVYNGAATIERALKSVFDQTFTDYEVVVVDDGSTDDTPAVLAKYGDKLRVVRQANRGLPAARNAAIAASRGELLALIDHDDEWLPQKLEFAVAAMRADPGAALLYSDMIVVNEAGEEFRRSQIGSDTAHAPTMDEMLARIWPITPSTVVMRRDAFDRAGGFCEQLISAEDIHFWLLMREQGHFIYLPEKLVRFTYGQLFPKVLNRDIGPTAIVDLIRQRYGTRADGLVKDFIRHRVRMIANAGVIEMSRGNMEGARRCFVRVLKYDPRHVKSYMRIARTYLPAPIRRALGGKASRGG